MAMTKAEKEAMQVLRERAALTLPPYEEPARMRVIQNHHAVTVGWWMNAYSKEVGQGCTNGFAHSLRSTTKTDSRDPGRFWETKLDALKALRWELTRRCMAELARIDEQVEAAKAEGRDE